MTEKLLKREVIEAMLTAANLKEDAAFNDQLKKALPDFAELMTQPEVPLETVNQAQLLAAKHLFPNLQADLALAQLGSLSFEGFRQTNIGKILLAALNVWGIERTIQNIPQVFNGVVRYGTRTVKKIGDKHYHLTLEDTPNHLPFVIGIISKALKTEEVTYLGIDIVSEEPNKVILGITWEN
jgi:uncharacterized protein (TIGR02265 family)